MRGDAEGRHVQNDGDVPRGEERGGKEGDRRSDPTDGETKEGCDPAQKDTTTEIHPCSSAAVRTERRRNMEKIETLRVQVKEAKESLQDMQARIQELKNHQHTPYEATSLTVQVDRSDSVRPSEESVEKSLPSLEDLDRTQELVERASAALLDGIRVLCSNDEEQLGVSDVSRGDSNSDFTNEARETKVQLLMRELSLEIRLGQVRTKASLSKLMMKHQEMQVKALINFLSAARDEGTSALKSLSEGNLATSQAIPTTRDSTPRGQNSAWTGMLRDIDFAFAECNQAVSEKMDHADAKATELLGEVAEVWSVSKASIQSSIELCAQLPLLAYQREVANTQLQAARQGVSRLEPLRSTFQSSLHILSTNRNRLLRQVEHFGAKLKELATEARSWKERIENGSQNSAALDRQLACLSRGVEKAYTHEKALSCALLQAHNQHAKASSEYKGLRCHLGKVEAQHRQFQEQLARLKKRRNAVESSNRSLKKEVELKARQNEAASVRQGQCVRNLLTQNQTTEALLSRLKDCEDLRAQSEIVLQQREAEIQGARRRIVSLHEQVAQAEVEASLLLDDVDRFVSPYIALSAARTRVADLERRFEDSTDPTRSRLPSTSLLSTMTSDKENLALIIEDVQERIREQDTKLSNVMAKQSKAERDIAEMERQIIAVRHGDGLDDAKKINALQYKVRNTSQYVMALMGERGMWVAKISSLQAELERMERFYGKPEEARLRWSADAKTMERIRQLPSSLQEVKDWAEPPAREATAATNKENKDARFATKESALAAHCMGTEV